jgi:hypothetical protein
VSERDVNARVMHPGEPAELVDRLRDSGLLTFTGHPMEQLLSDVIAAVPARAGVDLALSSGIQKIWLIFPELVEVDRLLAFPGMPEAARAHVDHLTRWGGRIGIMAVDFAARTINLYSQVLTPGLLSPDDIAAILAELDFAPAPAEELTMLGRTFNLYRTFAWDSPRMRRICFPLRCSPATFPTHLHPVLGRFLDKAPFADPTTRGFVFYIVYGPHESDHYYKVQAEYAAARHATFPGGAEPRVD